MAGDPFLDDAPRWLLLNIARRKEPLERTMEAIMGRLSDWERPVAFLEFMTATGDTLPGVMIRWWRLAAQIPTRQELADLAAGLERGEIEAVEPEGELAAGLERARLAHGALSDEERARDAEQSWQNKAARIRERAVASRDYLEMLSGLEERERRYLEVLADDLIKHRSRLDGA